MYVCNRYHLENKRCIPLGGTKLKVREAIRAVDGNVLTGEEYLDKEIEYGCGSDLMSDVLAFVKEDTLLLTGLTNIQVIRTAEIIDVFVIIFVRGKIPTNNIIKLAKEKKIILITTEHTLFEACGRLYKIGLKGKY